ncbi:aminopeptidase P family protein [Heliobacterium chlorum]|uniref:Aminopeptidase P family protein n=1 Tax=Heliobacterium chlorum TaxID=2698 RepID=A0ABR7T6Y5_HELCL|nr:Xaa-Pro peptidase family protein [Heliobacterium chlorum]MBC9785725.1 aminopeptidase P family protein [Heliobacterium chlorum]
MLLTPKSELDRRIHRLQQLLTQEGIDGMIIVQNADLFYFAGTIQRSHLFIPAEGKPLLFVKRSYERAKEESALSEIIPLDNPKDLPAMLSAHGHTSLNTLGFELDVLPASQFFRYQKLFAGIRLVDGSSLIRTVRAIKSEYEIGLMKLAGEQSRGAFDYVSQCLQAGISELELASQVEAFYRAQGHPGHVRTRGFNMDIGYGQLSSGTSLAIPSFFEGPIGGTGLSPLLSMGSGTKIIERDETVFVDYVGIREGYMVDATRVFCIGKLPDHLVRAHGVSIEIQHLLKTEGRPGVTGGELYEKAVALAKKHGLKEHFMGYADQVAFVGHGIGIELDEWPVIAKGVKTPLEAGMVFAMEPKFVFPEGAVGLEDTFVVRPEGLEAITEYEEGIIYLP